MLRDFYRLEDLGVKNKIKPKLKKLLDDEVLHFVEENVEFDEKTVILDTDSIFSVEIIEERVNSILNFRLVNNYRWINKYFEAINSKLNTGGLFLGCVETYNQRRQRILKRFHPIISYPYYFYDFISKRVLPKLKITEKILNSPGRCEERAISRVETYGRLYASGFELVREKKINNLLFFIFKKVGTPKYEAEKHCGMVIKLQRIGKNGKEMEVKKLRTMYAYSEYLQDFIYKRNLLETGGKFKNDYRVTSWGKILRTFWIDELPMLWNWFRREVQLVGVRPLSRQYFDMYEDDLKRLRTKYKPGLIPPFYADMPKTLPEIMESEKRYLEAYDKNPLKTQWHYFWKVMYNIVIKNVRSR